MKKSKINRCLATLIPLLVLTVPAQALTSFTDYFSATSLNTTRWSLTNEGGRLSQSSGRLNFTTTASTRFTNSYVILKNISPSYNENWEVLLDVSNKSPNDWAWMGIAVLNAADFGDSSGLELAVSGLQREVFSDYSTNGIDAPDIETPVNAQKVYLRIRFNKSDKVMTYSYRTSNTAAWKKHSTFSTKGSTLTTRRGNWNMTSTSRFTIAIYGGSEFTAIASGILSADNFRIRNY